MLPVRPDFRSNSWTLARLNLFTSVGLVVMLDYKVDTPDREAKSETTPLYSLSVVDINLEDAFPQTT